MTDEGTKIGHKTTKRHTRQAAAAAAPPQQQFKHRADKMVQMVEADCDSTGGLVISPFLSKYFNRSHTF